MRIYRGQSLTEMGILIAIVAIVSISVLTFLGTQNKDILNNVLAKYKGFNPFNVDINGPKSIDNIQKGSLNGTISMPKSQCDGDTCVIDYGDFILKGIPEDFSSYIKTHGASRGNDVLTNLLNTLTEAYDETSHEDLNTKLKKLAALSDVMQQVNNVSRSKVSDCATNPDPIACTKALNLNPGDITLTPIQQSLLPDFLLSSELVYNSLSNNDLYTTYNEVESMGTPMDGAPGYEFFKLAQEVMSDPNMTPATIELVQSITKTTQEINGAMHGEYFGINCIGKTCIGGPITYDGSDYGEIDITNTDGINDLLNLDIPDTSLENLVNSLH